MYYFLRLSRAFEERLSLLNRQGKLMGGIYSGIGQEAITVGTVYGLRREDFISPLHRDLGAFLVKGVPPGVLMAQVFGKRDGLSRGKDSYLHAGDTALGIFGNTSMLGSNLPVACGIAYGFKLRQQDHVVLAYFGEGAANYGDVHEAMNFAAVNRLAVVFVCENNLYAYSTPFEKAFAIAGGLRPRPGLRVPRRGRLRQRPPAGPPRDPGGHRPGPARATAPRSSSARPSAGTATPSTTAPRTGPRRS